MSHHITDTTQLKCDKGTTPAPIAVTSQTFMQIEGKLQATEEDNKPNVNIKPFGACSITHSSCAPAPIKWQDTSVFEIDGKKELLDNSTCQCSVGGKISVIKSAQSFSEEVDGSIYQPIVYLKDEEEETDEGIEYIYYTKDGFYLGGTENSTNVYLASQEEYDKAKKDKKWSLINKESNLLKENTKIISHLKLISLSATCYGECSLEYNVDVKRELYAIAYVHFHHPENVAYGANSDGAKSFKAKNAIDRNNKTMQVAIGASINAYTNGFDFSYGADSWDGIDVLTGGSWNKWMPENHYRQRASGKNKGISDPKNISPTFYATAKKALEDKIESPKVSDKLKKDYKAKYAHLQPLIVSKENKTYKPLFEVVATYAVSVFYKTLK